MLLPACTGTARYVLPCVTSWELLAIATELQNAIARTTCVYPTGVTLPSAPSGSTHEDDPCRARQLRMYRATSALADHVDGCCRLRTPVHIRTPHAAPPSSEIRRQFTSARSTYLQTGKISPHSLLPIFSLARLSSLVSCLKPCFNASMPY